MVWKKKKKKKIAAQGERRSLAGRGWMGQVFNQVGRFGLGRGLNKEAFAMAGVLPEKFPWEIGKPSQGCVRPCMAVLAGNKVPQKVRKGWGIMGGDSLIFHEDESRAAQGGGGSMEGHTGRRLLFLPFFTSSFKNPGLHILRGSTKARIRKIRD